MKKILTGILFLFVLCCTFTIDSEAAAKYEKYYVYEETAIGKYTVMIDSSGLKAKRGAGEYKVIDGGIIGDYGVISNGTTIYYIKMESGNSVVYRVKLNGKSNKKIVKLGYGENYGLIGFYKNRLYYEDETVDPVEPPVHCYNISKKKTKKNVVKSVNGLYFNGNNMYYMHNSGAFMDLPIYRATLEGKSKKVIVKKSYGFKVISGKIYSLYTDQNGIWKLTRYNIKGKSPKIMIKKLKCDYVTDYNAKYIWYSYNGVEYKKKLK